MLGCYLSPSQPNVCRATRPSPSPTVRIAILSIFRGERCQIGAALAEEPECPVNPQSDPMSIACNERNRTAPLQGAANPYGADTLQGHKILLHIHPAAEQRHIPRPTEQNISRIATHCVLWRIPPARTAIFALPRPFDCCFALGVIYGGCKGSFWLWRVAMAGSKMRINSESEAGSFSLRGRPRRGQIEAGRETLTAYEGDAVVAGPPAGGGWRRRRRDDGCT